MTYHSAAAETVILSFSSLPLSVQNNLRTLFVSHGLHDGKDGKHKVMMPRQGLVSGQIAAKCKADGMMYPLQELNVIGWHFPPCSWRRLLRKSPPLPDNEQEEKKNARGCELILEICINYS